MIAFKWKNPPKVATKAGVLKKGAYHSVWSQVGDRLRERPARWAHVATYQTNQSTRTIASAIRRGRLNLGEGEFEVAVDGCDLYMRCVG